MQVEPAPSARAGQRREPQHSNQQGVFKKVEKVVVGIVESDIEHDVLVGKHQEGVQERPPSQQHQKIQHAEVDSSFFLHQIRTPGDGRDDGHDVKKHNDVEGIRIGNLLVEHDLATHPADLIAYPKR